jgi:divalent metal cation (Fe/Co/Zn/Cd) transporter
LRVPISERDLWIRRFLQLALFTAIFHFLQFGAALLLWISTNSAVLMAFGLDALVSGFAAICLAARIEREWRNRFIAFGYMAAAAGTVYLGGSMLWTGGRARSTVPGIALAAVSMLVIPILGSYMKVLAVELRSQALKSAAIFTFGNSYLSMVLLIALLLNIGMDLRWGDPLGALVMFPFMAQKGIQILLEKGKHEYVED